MCAGCSPPNQQGTAVEFALQKDGRDVLAERMRASRAYARVFNGSEEVFEQLWRDDLLKRFAE